MKHNSLDLNFKLKHTMNGVEMIINMEDTLQVAKA